MVIGGRQETRHVISLLYDATTRPGTERMPVRDRTTYEFLPIHFDSIHGEHWDGSRKYWLALEQDERFTTKGHPGDSRMEQDQRDESSSQ